MVSNWTADQLVNYKINFHQLSKWTNFNFLLAGKEDEQEPTYPLPLRFFTQLCVGGKVFFFPSPCIEWSWYTDRTWEVDW